MINNLPPMLSVTGLVGNGQLLINSDSVFAVNPNAGYMVLSAFAVTVLANGGATNSVVASIFADAGLTAILWRGWIPALVSGGVGILQQAGLWLPSSPGNGLWLRVDSPGATSVTIASMQFLPSTQIS